MFATFLLVYLALRSVRDARDLRVIQSELTVLMCETKELAEELHGLQGEIRTDQRAAKDGIEETKRTVEQVSEVVEQAADQVTEAAEQVADVATRRSRFRRPWRRGPQTPVSATAGGRARNMRRSRSSSWLCDPIETRKIRRSSHSYTR